MDERVHSHSHLDDEEEDFHAHSHGGCSHGHAHDEHHTHSHSHSHGGRKPNETPKKPVSSASDKTAQRSAKQEFVYDKNGFFSFMNDARTRLWVYSVGSTLIISAFPFLILGVIPIQVGYKLETRKYSHYITANSRATPVRTLHCSRPSWHSEVVVCSGTPSCTSSHMPHLLEGTHTPIHTVTVLVERVRDMCMTCPWAVGC